MAARTGTGTRAVPMASTASAFSCVPGSSSGTGIFSTQAAKAGRADTAGMRYRNRTGTDPRAVSFPGRGDVRWRRMFFAREPKLAREAPDGIGGRSNAGCVMRGGGAFGHRNVAISFDDFDGKPPMGGEVAFPLGATSRRGAPAPGSADRKAPSGSGCERKP